KRHSQAGGGISVAELEKCNRMISDLLDVEDNEKRLFPHAYDLEVGSPGLDRPLTKKSHFQRALGKQVRIKTKVAVDNARSFNGTVSAADEENVVVDAHTIPLQDIHSAHVVHVFEAPKKPGKKS
ncbi:MAG TPA: ribosome maturation factor RimP, partial [Myxococcota bacterium]